MARGRIIRPEFFSDTKICKLSYQARILFIGIWCFADDYGVIKGTLSWIKAQVFELEDETISAQVFKKWISELLEQRLIIQFEADEKNYFYIVNWNKHQTVQHPSKTRNPEPPENLNFDNQVLLQERPKQDKSEAREVLKYFNEISNRNFTAESYVTMINARLKKNTIDDLKLVIRFKVWQNSVYDGWPDQDKPTGFPSDYLNPETLFRPSKFDKYLQDAKEFKASKNE